MGTYYRVVCHEKKQFIDPSHIANEANPGGACIKHGCIVLGPLMHIVAEFAILGAWSGRQFSIVDDYSSEYDCDFDGYEDVTEQAINAFPKEWWRLILGGTCRYISEDEQNAYFEKMTKRWGK